MMKKIFALCMCLLMLASSASAAALQLPSPKEVHSGAKVEISEHMTLTDGEKKYATTLYRYTFDAKPSSFAGDMPGLDTYVIKMKSSGFDVERRSYELTKREYEIRHNGTPVAFMIANYSEWLLFLREGVTFAPVTKTSGGSGFGDGNFDFDPNAILPGGRSGGGSSKCRTCNGTGNCIGCNGDGIFDNMYEPNLHSACNQCGRTGDCRDCNGTGIYR